jgi:Lipid A core - O-antigen ligase and related enzymes
LVGVSTLIIAKQVHDPSFTPIFSNRPAQLPSGFYGHYNEGANFLIGSSFFLASFALFGSQGKMSRWVWGIVAIGGLIAVYFTRSRGGILATGIGTMVFVLISLIVAKRRDYRWFRPAAILLPFLLIAVCGFVFQGWAGAQKFRFQEEVGTIMDGSVRLKLYGIALSCLDQHPWTGGGSRSFSWECNQFWDFQSHGPGVNRPEYVHNELLQAATDYGLIGFLLLVILIGWVTLLTLTRSLLNDSDSITSADAWRAGAIAGLAGMLVQSSFSFVFHLLPGILLLGLCLAKAATPTRAVASTNHLTRSLLVLTSILGCLYLIPMGWNGSRVFGILWSVYVRPDESIENRISKLNRAIPLWEEVALYRERATTLQRSASLESGVSATQKISLAIDDYRRAIKLHPYEASTRINLAKLESACGNNEDATKQYLAATYLQGGMEAGYRGHFQFAEHLIRKGRIYFEQEDYDQSLTTFQAAWKQFEKVAEKTPWLPNHEEGFTLKLSILQGLGASHEALGNINEALDDYNGASQIIGGSSSNYRAALLLGGLAKTAWSERRPSEALTRFEEARERITLATELPSGVTPEMKADYVAFLDRSIQYLVEAKVEPLKKADE